MNYDIKKDAKPEDTVKRIKSILEKYKIDINENNTGQGENHNSCRLKINLTDIGVNGKGTSEINSLASGYAELMERLQTQWLISYINKNYEYDADETTINTKDYIDILSEFKATNKNINFVDIKKLRFFMLSCRSKNPQFENKNEIIPFISYKTKKLKYISPYLFDFFQGTNGLAAGNTYEEACVQALSEITERYCAKEIILNQINMPTIPEKEYKIYSKLNALIKEIEKLGYKITVKDASLGKNFPTICCVFKDLRTIKGTVIIKFGTHPHFPIALERTLTEFLQGYTELSENRIYQIDSTKPNNIKLENIAYSNSLSTIRFKTDNEKIKNFLSDKEDYKFSKKPWSYNSSLTNRELFNQYSNFILKHTKDIYIRNCSFLEFPTVKIYIPSLSISDTISPYYLKNWSNIINISNKIQEEVPFDIKDIESLVNATKYLCETNAKSQIDSYIGLLRVPYLGFYCAVLTKNKRRIKYYLRKMLNYEAMNFGTNKENKELRKYQAFKKYIDLHYKGIQEDKIKEIMLKKYSMDLYKESHGMFTRLNMDSISKTLIPKKREENFEKYISRFEKQLGELYWRNKPNQDEIVKIIDYKPSFKEKIKNLFIS